MDVATLIRDCRRRAGLSQRELAERAGTSAAALCLYERGARVPRADTLARVVAASGSRLRMEAIAPSSRIDPAVNGRVLVDLLDLADRLPKRRTGALSAPPFRSLTS